YTWKVAVVMDAGEGIDDVHSTSDVQVLAVRMPNLVSTAVDTTDWMMFATTVDVIEAAVGLDLLAALPDWIERIVEANDRYPTATAPATAAGVEGTAISFTGAGSDPDAGAALTYTWTFGDGATASGATASHSYADDGAYAAMLVVADEYGAADTVHVAVTVTNAAPVVTLAGAALLEGETYAPTGTFTDGGSGDTHTATVDYGTGAGSQAVPVTGTSFTLSNVYASAGSYTVAVAVTDDDGATGGATATVVVLGGGAALTRLIADIEVLVAAGSISKGNATALKANLENARKLLDRGNAGGRTAAVNDIDAFLNKLDAMTRSGNVPAAAADSLRQYALRIRGSID
ncbi:MAG TPA: PKD domain-containing protein, partial [Planctomycetota bacterium]|nr:PKD domain-containing protein [Planctomycetota bacterium]